MKTSKLILSILSWLYLACIGAAALLMYTQGDLWWPATLLLFGPRWVLGLPLLLLIPLALFRRRFLLLPLGVSLLIFLWPLLGYNVVLDAPQAAPGRSIRVLSCNTMVGNADRAALAALIRDYSVDVVALQELPREYKFPVPRDWHCHKEGGLAVCSRFPLEPGQSVATLHPPHKWKRYSGVSAVLDTGRGKVAFFAVHLPSARYGLQNVISRSLGVDPAKAGLLDEETSGREEASELVRSLADQTRLPTIVAGDFNMPRQSRIFRHVWGSFQDAFEETTNGYGWTFFDAYKGIPVPLAIDHVVTRNGAVPLDFFVGPEVNSDHRPIIVDVALSPAQ